MNRKMGKWEKEDGIKFLKKIGIREGQRILDFGTGVGHYTIPAARIVGKRGKVYAIDKDKDSLDELREKAIKQGLKNIILIKTNGSLEIDLGEDSIDVALVYDVLHYMDNEDERRELHEETHRVLRDDGLFSLYPKHNKLDDPSGGLEDLAPEDIKKEIESCGFSFEKEYCGMITHGDDLNHGCILNFRKNT